MFCVTVGFELDPDHVAPFLARMRRQAADSLAREPGCKVFEVWTSTAEPHRVRLHEIYDDAAAFDAHLASDHFRAFDAEVAPMVRSRVIERWDVRA